MGTCGRSILERNRLTVSDICGLGLGSPESLRSWDENPHEDTGIEPLNCQTSGQSLLGVVGKLEGERAIVVPKVDQTNIGQTDLVPFPFPPLLRTKTRVWRTAVPALTRLLGKRSQWFLASVFFYFWDGQRISTGVAQEGFATFIPRSCYAAQP